MYPIARDMRTSSEIAYETMHAVQAIERSVSTQLSNPVRNTPPVVEFARYDLTWSDKVFAVPRVRPKWDNTSAYLTADARSPPNFPRGSYDVQQKDSSLVPRVEEHDLMMRFLGHTNSSNRAPRARSDLW